MKGLLPAIQNGISRLASTGNERFEKIMTSECFNNLIHYRCQIQLSRPVKFRITINGRRKTDTRSVSCILPRKIDAKSTNGKSQRK